MQAYSSPEFDGPLWGMVLRGVEMHRDDEYLRELIVSMADSDDWRHLLSRALSPGQEAEKRHFHILLLVDAGFMVEIEQGTGFYRITNAGHDFIAMTNQDERWEAVKAASRRLGGASVQMLYRIAEGYARQKLGELGVPFA